MEVKNVLTICKSSYLTQNTGNARESDVGVEIEGLGQVEFVHINILKSILLVLLFMHRPKLVRIKLILFLSTLKIVQIVLRRPQIVDLEAFLVFTFHLLQEICTVGTGLIFHLEVLGLEHLELVALEAVESETSRD